MPSSHTQRVHDALREQIVTGALEPGERLKVEDLKQTLNVGASPIREALSLLTSDQLVERHDQRGFRVAQASAAHFDEVLMLRCTLESKAVRASVAKGDAAWAGALSAALDALSETSRDDRMAFETRHKAFHMALLSACEAPMLLNLCSQLYDQNVRYRNIVVRRSDYAARDVSHEHADICAAALDRDAEFASALLIGHYRRTAHLLSATLVTLYADAAG